MIESQHFESLSNGKSKRKKRESVVDYEYFMNSTSKRRTPAPLRELTHLLGKLPRERINLGVGYPNSQSFPFQEIKITLKDGTSIDITGKYVEEAFQYLPSVGYSPLLEILKDFQDRIHGAQPWGSRNLMICSGSQEGLSKAIEMSVSHGDCVIMQHPAYSGATDLFKPLNTDFILAEQDEYGIQPELLKQRLMSRAQEGKSMPKVMYVNPTASNPTGTTLTTKRKKEIYSLAQKYDFLILEDDAYFHLHFLKENPTSFLSLDTDGRVIRFDSFSKILSSGIRIGFVTGPTPLIRRMELHMQVSCMHASALSQVLLFKLLTQWGYEGFKNHLASIKQFYLSKRNGMLALANKHLRDVAEWNEPTGGMFLWVKLKNIGDVRNLVMNKFVEKLIVVAPGYVFYENTTKTCPYLRISYSAASDVEVEKAFSDLAIIIKNEEEKNNGNGISASSVVIQ